MQLKNVLVIVLFCTMLTVLFSIPQIKTTYTVEAKNVDYGECNLQTDICVAPWLENDDSTPEGYLRNQMIKNGLESEIDFVFKMIQCESGWKTDIIGLNQKSFDRGLWQIWSGHKDISNEDTFNYKKATDWAINKRLKDKSWIAWVCASKVK